MHISSYHDQCDQISHRLVVDKVLSCLFLDCAALEVVEKMQHLCFIDKRISLSTYKTNVKVHEERISQIKHTLPILKSELNDRKLRKKKEKKISTFLKIRKARTK